MFPGVEAKRNSVLEQRLPFEALPTCSRELVLMNLHILNDTYTGVRVGARYAVPLRST